MIRIIFMGIIILGNNESNHSRGYHYSWQQWNRPAPIVSSTWTRILLGVAWKLIESIFMIINHRYPPLQQHNLLSIDIHTLEWICRREWKQLWPHPVPSGKQPQACSWGKVWLPTLLCDQIVFIVAIIMIIKMIKVWWPPDNEATEVFNIVGFAVAGVTGWGCLNERIWLWICQLYNHHPHDTHAQMPRCENILFN